MKPNEDFLAGDGAKEAVDQLKGTEKKNTKKVAKISESIVEKLEPGLDEKLKVERLAQKDFIQMELKKFDIAESVVAEWNEQYMGLVVTDATDKESIEKATEAYKLVRNTRITIEKKRKELKESALTFGRAVDTEARRLTALIEPLETHLEAQKNFIEAEKEKVRAAKEEAQKARMTERTNKLLALGMVYNGETFELIEGEEKLILSSLDAKMLDEASFNIIHLKAEILREKHLIRIKEEQEAARVEKERVEKIAAEQKAESEHLEKLRKEQEEKAVALEKEKAAFEEQKREAERQKQKEIEIAQAAAKAKENAEKEKQEALAAAEQKRLDDIARIEKENADRIAAEKKAAEDKIAAEAKAKQEAEAVEKAEQERIAKEEALKPDRLRILDFSNYIKGLKLPELTSEEGKEILVTITAQHTGYVKWLNSLVDKLK